MRGEGHAERMGEKRNAYRMLVWKTYKEKPLGRPRHRWTDVRMDFREKGCESVDWIHLAQDMEQWWALLNMVMNLLVS
jgi:hypothetical protein